MTTPVYRHTTCDGMIQAKMPDLACIGCGGKCIFFDMDVPAARRDVTDPASRIWLLRNLGIRNGRHELFNTAIEMIKQLEPPPKA